MKSLSLMIYPPHERISSQDMISSSSMISIISKPTEQLESNKHMNDTLIF